VTYDWPEYNREIIEEFRFNGGRVARFGGLPVVILHTIGARSGRVREVPLITIIEGEDMLLFGTAAGSPKHPDWYYNLRANPEINVEYGTEQFAARVVQLSDEDARARVEDQVRNSEQFAGYQASAAPRAIPVFTIRRR
jgi:deazaflavin-dependent oxidoreductase (nitroreductase family)